ARRPVDGGAIGDRGQNPGGHRDNLPARARPSLPASGPGHNRRNQPRAIRQTLISGRLVGTEPSETVAETTDRAGQDLPCGTDSAADRGPLPAARVLALSGRSPGGTAREVPGVIPPA